jgi:hypothetical protein
MAPLIPLLLKSKSIQGVIVALGGYFTQKFGADPGSVLETVGQTATALGAAWGTYGIRDAIKPFSMPVEIKTVKKTREPRGPNKPKATPTVVVDEESSPGKRGRPRRSTQEIIAALEGGNSAEQPVANA